MATLSAVAPDSGGVGRRRGRRRTRTRRRERGQPGSQRGCHASRPLETLAPVENKEALGRRKRMRKTGSRFKH